MPYCSQCGTQAGEHDLFCAKCGGRQPVQPRQAQDLFGSLTPKTAATLCYVPMIGWIAAVIVLAADRFRQDKQVRFHAFQGLYLFVAWLIAHQVLRPLWNHLSDNFVPADKILEGTLVIAGIFMLVKTSHDESYALPILGDLAQKSAAEH